MNRPNSLPEWRSHRSLILVYILLLIAGIIPVLLWPKGELHLYLNQWHHRLGNTLFPWITHLGDGNLALIIAFSLACQRIRAGLILLLSFVGSGLLVQLFKRFVFPDLQRPIAFFDNHDQLNLVEGVEMASQFSFPSGHATTAFAIYFGLALLHPHRLAQMGWLLVAVVVAYSRVYLSLHFLGDILAGSVLGVVTALISYYWLREGGPAWLDRRLFSLRKMSRPG